MPFRSQAQARFMFSQHPEIAQRFAAETPSISALPQHAHLTNPRQRVAVAILLSKKNANRPT